MRKNKGEETDEKEWTSKKNELSINEQKSKEKEKTRRYRNNDERPFDKE